ncbi:hypothetical protein [Phenylobacterium sp.]|jgi:hypothetical protein|uniref:hypothetical protein n=1 Tax=Phenylobacterium sp. TaxID=1871053 RepID=UPI002F3F58FC
MNAWPWLFFSGPTTRRIARLTACAGLGTLAAACVGDPVGAARIDPASPIAADATRLVKANRRVPTFAQIPPAPKDVRLPRAFRSAVVDTEAARDRLIAATGPGAWTLTGTEGFADRASAQADDEAVSARDTEGFARTGRERATPPPPAR